MKFGRSHQKQGIALIIVMIVIIVLGVLAGGLAYSMKVETRLARNSSFDADMDNLGRNGVERARYILSSHLRDRTEGSYTSLQQFWSSGLPSTNEYLIGMSLVNEEFPAGETEIWMTDMESKFNLSAIRDDRFSPILQKALETMGIDPIQVTDIVDSYLDWVDPDDNKRLHGAESQFYATLNPAAPYVAKNGLMDDISELLLIRGMTPEIYYGAGRSGMQLGRAGQIASAAPIGNPGGGGGGSAGLVDLFTTISSAGMAVNANTAKAEVLQLIPGMDAALAQSIIDTRAGPDHVDGTIDDIPFLQRGELINVPGMTPEISAAMSQYLVTHSSIFMVQVEARLGNFVRRYEALLYRRNAMDVSILYFRAL